LILDASYAINSLTVADPSEFGGIQPAGGSRAIVAAGSGFDAPLAVSPVPEPGTLLLLTALGSAVACYRFSKRRGRDGSRPATS
jgi:hypothetical protein